MHSVPYRQDSAPRHYCSRVLFVEAQPVTALPSAILSPRSCFGAREQPRILSRFVVHEHFQATSSRRAFEKLPEQFPVLPCGVLERIASKKCLRAAGYLLFAPAAVESRSERC